ncbi:MAG: acetolactate synthase, large subunit, biosynthetic type [Clostridiales bacterium GWF2_38_85]|nr:MAG: acetolactate synthase, large subunit, biosynthetic type [Clostridiales bacterium GWF2_38_85]HBL83640.1 biosynthetic-type acetolactate synthase large subunit [Clostridiales bacterium]
MKLTGARIIIETLIEQDCETVFGYPGGFVINIYDELYKASDRIHHVISAHEQGAAHAADGYARASGKVGVVIATSGPGATNLVTGIANAFLDSVPLVAITGNVPLALLGRDSFQEVDIMGITMPITKHNYIVKDVNELASILRDAFRIAKSGRPGPVLVDIPKDIQLATCEYKPGKPVEKTLDVLTEQINIDKIVELIEASNKPYIYSGGGVVISNAGDELKQFAERIDAPVGFSMMGLSAMDGSLPNNLGLTGMHGRYASIKANSETDLLIAIGVRFSDRATGNKLKYSPNAKIIHIDIDPAEIDKNINTYFGVIGDVKYILNKLLEKVKPKKHPEWKEEINRYIADEQANYPQNYGMHPKNIIERVNNLIDDKTVIATDVGQHQMWVAQYFKLKGRRTFLTSGGLGTMGYGMGAAIGGCFGSGNQRTVLFTGDGSFGMNLAELATAVSNNLPLVIIIMNNGVLGMVRQWQTIFFDERYSSTTLDRKTDFVLLAKAFGANGMRVVGEGELSLALETAFSIKTPFVIDCVIDCDERVLPMIPPGGSVENIIIN